VQVLCGLVQAGFFVHGGGVNDEDEAADICGVGEGRGGVVAQLAVAGGVEQDEAARALKGRVAGGAVVRRGGDVGAGEEGLDGEGGGGGVGGGDGAALGLWWWWWCQYGRVRAVGDMGRGCIPAW